MAHPEENWAYRRFSLAYQGSPAGLHAYFVEALRRAESPEINAEAGEALWWELLTLVRRVGDARFASALAAESARARSAVAGFLAPEMVRAYPATESLLKGAPKIDFPLNQTYRGDYRPKDHRP